MTSGGNTQVSLPTYETLLTEAISSLAVDSGTVTSPIAAGGNTLQDATKRWALNMHTNRIVKVLSGTGRGQGAFIQGNSQSALVIRGTWPLVVEAGSRYAIVNADYAQVLRDVFGGGVNVSAANPLPVDVSSGLKTTRTILNLPVLVAGATSTLANCTGLDLRHGPSSLALTVVATYNGAATLGLRVHVRTSPDDVAANYDTEDWDTWDAQFVAGAAIRHTENYDTDPMYIRVLIENLDAAQAITLLSVIASVGV